MAAGGARPGAGRPKGAANKLNDKARAEALAGGISPLDYLLGVLRDEGLDRDTRMDAAKAAAPYVHAGWQRSSTPATRTSRSLIL
jgi:hypothetical protein